MSLSPQTVARRWLHAASCLLLALALSGEARAQAPYYGFDWFSVPWTTDWVSQYWADDAEEEGTRLAAIPDMFGDSFARGGALTATNLTGPAATSTTDVLLAGGSRGLKVGEHNKALPVNRVYAVYNHFHNATETEIASPLLGAPLVVTSPIDRYTVGLETRFAEGLWSLELRMPFTGDLEIADPLGLAESHGGQVGNLSVILKRLVYYDATTSVVVGLGMETPTGSDFHSRTVDVEYEVSNDAVHLHPYLGVLHAPNDCLFFHGFLQLDVATHGSLVTFDAGGGPVAAGRYNDQALLYADLGGGYWLYRCPCACGVTGVAALLEVHYTTTLNDTDTLTAAPTIAQSALVANPANRMDVVNLTAAIHMELARYTSFRIGGVFPLTDPDDRFFDAELTAQLIRRF